MSCDRYREAIAEAAAGAGANSGLEAHVGRCEACRRELDARRKALALADAEMTGLLASEPSSELLSRIRRAVAGDHAPRWRPSRPALAAAAALLIALGTVAAWRAASRPPTPETTLQARLAPTPSPGLRDDRTAPASASRQQTARTALAEGAAGERRPSEPLPAPEGPPGSESPPAPSVGSIETEVLVPAGQQEALLRFASELQSRTVTPDSLLVAERSAPLNEPRPLHRVEIEMLALDSFVVSGL